MRIHNMLVVCAGIGLFLTGVWSLPGVWAEEPLTQLRLLPDEKHAQEVLKRWLLQRCQEALQRRREAFEKLESLEDCLAWAQARREFFQQSLGPWPPRTPLNPQVVGTLQGQGFRVEKVIFESHPRHYVTALLYVPTGGKGPFPGVLLPCGHSINGKAAAAYQRAAMLMARQGMVVLCYDPIGQGERYQILRQNPNEPAHPRAAQYHPRARFLSTTEHTLVGVGAILLGTNVARYRIWDGMRALDYLQSRKEVDPKRIGCTGNSGGGTLTAYLMALDQRIWAAAPACYLTDFEHLLPRLGPQDAEQNIFGQVAFGLNHADYVLMRAPRPTAILAATFDGFDIRGTWASYRQAKRFYGLLGYPERVQLVEARAPHGFSTLLRQGAVRWMLLHLKGQYKEIFDEPLTPYEDKQVQCTPEGQVMLLPAARSAFDLNWELALRLRPQRRSAWKSLSPDQRRQKVQKVLGTRPLASLPKLKAQPGKSFRWKNCQVHTWVLELEPGLPMPVLAVVPSKVRKSPVLLLHPQGKQVLEKQAALAKQLLQGGHAVLVVELPGCGETRPTRPTWASEQFGPLYHETMLLYLLGRSMVALRTEHLAAVAHWAQKHPRLSPADSQGVQLLAWQELTVPALHAAALYPGLFAQVELRQGIRSWEEVVRAPVTQNQLINTVHGALKVYDLPDLVHLAGADRVKVSQVVDVLGQPVEGEEFSSGR